MIGITQVSDGGFNADTLVSDAVDGILSCMLGLLSLHYQNIDNMPSSLHDVKVLCRFPKLPEAQLEVIVA